MSWNWDAPSGVFKDHFLSAKIREAAVADSHFMRFLTPERGYGKGKGGTVNITRFGNLPLATTVTEQDRLPEGKPPITMQTLDVDEWGFKVKMTELEENLTHFNLRNPTQRALRDQMRLTMDKMAADALKTTVIKAIGTATGVVTFDTDGTPSSEAAVNMDIGHLATMYDYLRGTQKSPAFKNGRYIGILSTKAARGLKGDSTFREWFSRTGDKKTHVTGLLSNIEGFDLFETNHFDALDNTIGASNTATGEAVFFGEDAAFLAVVDEPELRMGAPEDLGRFRDIGWVGTIQAGLVWDSIAQSRVIHWTSS